MMGTKGVSLKYVLSGNGNWEGLTRAGKRPSMMPMKEMCRLGEGSIILSRKGSTSALK